MKKFFKLFGIIALVVIIGFSMTACDDGGDDDNGGQQQGGVGVTVTVSIEKVNASTFTITLEGAKWGSSFEDGVSGLNYALFAEGSRQVTVTLNSYGSVMTGEQNVADIFELTNTSDTVGTFTLKENYSNVSGTIALNTDTDYAWAILGRTDVDSRKTNTLIINPAKASITF
jgi:hypothetical protein